MDLPQHLRKSVREGIMKWFYIAVGLIVAMVIVSFLQGPIMYTSKGDTVLPIHMGVDNGK